MKKAYKIYIGMILLLIIGLANIPFAWLHHCEYGHDHLPSESQNHYGLEINDEVPDCPYCDLDFPPYLPQSLSETSIQPAFGLCVSEVIESVFGSDYQGLTQLRSPPIC